MDDKNHPVLVMDIDDTICRTTNGDYVNSEPIQPMIDQINDYARRGFKIVFCTSRQMRTHGGNVGKINIHTLPNIINWLDRHGVHYDEIVVGKPWAKGGFYVDDKAIRPDEFVKYSYMELVELCAKSQRNLKAMET